jgi:hypothetical protein
MNSNGRHEKSHPIDNDEHFLRPESTGIRILIVGCGFAGLACAIESVRKGHDVVIFERYTELWSLGMSIFSRHLQAAEPSCCFEGDVSFSIPFCFRNQIKPKPSGPQSRPECWSFH